MATLKQRLHRKNADGGYDVVHLETSASVVMRADGSTSVEQSLTEIESWDLLKYEEAGDYAGMPYMEDDASTLEGHPASDFVLAANANFAASSHTHTKAEITDFPTTMTPAAHTHAASDVTSGTLGVARGGTGKASWAANRLMYPSAATTLAQLAFPSVAGSVLRQGTSGAPYWTSVEDLKSAINANGIYSAELIYTKNISINKANVGNTGTELIAALSTLISYDAMLEYDIIKFHFEGSATCTPGTSSSKYHRAGLTLSTASNTASVDDGFIMWFCGAGGSSVSSTTFECNESIFIHKSAIIYRPASNGGSYGVFMSPNGDNNNGDDTWFYFDEGHDLYLCNEYGTINVNGTFTISGIKL